MDGRRKSFLLNEEHVLVFPLEIIYTDKNFGCTCLCFLTVNCSLYCLFLVIRAIVLIKIENGKEIYTLFTIYLCCCNVCKTCLPLFKFRW